jgi:hypothetical protein
VRLPSPRQKRAAAGGRLGLPPRHRRIDELKTFLRAAASSWAIQPGVNVLDSTRTVPCLALAKAPLFPNQISPEMSSSETMLRITSAPEAASAGEYASFAPRFTKG